jgi:hypothetical protein
LRGCGRWRESRSEGGSVWARGVVGRREETLSSGMLLGGRARALRSAMLSMACMLSMSSAGVAAGVRGWAGGVASTVGWGACSCIEAAAAAAACVLGGVRTGVGPEREGAVVMVLSRSTRSSGRGSSCAEGGKDTWGVMAASWVNT